MPAPDTSASDTSLHASAPANFQAAFERRWGALQDTRVRGLAWLLDAPGLLDASHPHWQGKVKALGPVTAETGRWLFALDRDPTPLDVALGGRVYTRLGLYAEKLMAFYFHAQGDLVAHGLQVRASRNDTVGEFDFLLDAGTAGVEHIEFATKFYLLRESGMDGMRPGLDPSSNNMDALVGPNLADSLGAKMRKIVERQLVLGQHPAAQALLARPVVQARALVKGWLFYPLAEIRAGVRTIPAIDADHCRGFWCTLDDLAMLPEVGFSILPKLDWLAPYRTASLDTVLTRATLHATLVAQFAVSDAPVLVALLHQDGVTATEHDRGFIVPTSWPTAPFK
ncbi:MAG: DUF1853 family protein [Pseudomonadota bacterium]|nr:DUF1853 family protein [Pseudomonadota bacterium]